MFNDCSHQQLRNAAAAMVGQDKHIGNVSKRGEIGNYAGKANLLGAEICAEAQ